MNRVQAKNILPPPVYVNDVDFAIGSNQRIIDTLHKNTSRAIAETKELSQRFRGSTDKKTALNIWNFLKKEIEYKKDGFDQDIKLPSRFVSDGKGDCKSYSLFTSGILHNLGIPHKFRYTSYTPGDSTPQHVYIVLDNGIIIDGVWNKFDSEKKYSHKKDYKMRIRTLSGVSDQRLYDDFRTLDEYQIGGFGTWAKNVVKKTADAIKQAGKYVIDKAATVALIAPRNAYLVLLKLNFRGWASTLAKGLESSDTYDKIHSLWNKLGGNFTTMKVAINQGKTKKRIFGVSEVLLTGINCRNSIGEPATGTAGLVATATPIVIAAGALIKEINDKYQDTRYKVDETLNKYSPYVNTGGPSNKNNSGTENKGGGVIVVDNNTGEIVKDYKPVPTYDPDTKLPTETKETSTGKKPGYMIPLLALAGAYLIFKK